jgi:hypothetical protein
MISGGQDLAMDGLISREHMDFVQGRTYFAGGQESVAMCGVTARRDGDLPLPQGF